ncbi:MAG: hypothetical protein R6U64_08555 [Bacteroidales bacterium]
MKKFIITSIIACCFVSVSLAQDYNTGIGVRAGISNGLTIKHFVSERAALEGLIASRWQGIELTLLYEIHNQAFNTERLNWYYGFGGHVGFWDGRHTSDRWGEPDQQYTVIGLDGILGLEYNFSEIPINLSLDWKPAFNLSGHRGFWGDTGALSIRYIF